MKPSVLVWVLLLVGCAGTAHPTSPKQRVDAMCLFSAGATIDEVARKLAVDQATARDLIRSELVVLNRRFYRR